MRSGMDIGYHNFFNSEKYQVFIRNLNIPSLQQHIFLVACDREIVFIRDDQIHSVISGNKWRKLKFHLDYFLLNEFSGISSMGGCYSNHLHALAFVCDQLNIPCTLFIYGWNEELNSPTLLDCKNWNAELVSITRLQAAAYREYSEKEFAETLGGNYWIPEGGGGIVGERGIKDLMDELPADFDSNENLIVCACGTGTTIQGILSNSSNCNIASQQIVKMANYSWIKNERVKMIHSNYPHSFASSNPELLNLINKFNNEYGILLDPIYTGPLMYSFLQQRDWNVYRNIYFIHTGGLQANRIK